MILFNNPSGHTPTEKYENKGYCSRYDQAPYVKYWNDTTNTGSSIIWDGGYWTKTDCPIPLISLYFNKIKTMKTQAGCTFDAIWFTNLNGQLIWSKSFQVIDWHLSDAKQLHEPVFTFCYLTLR